MFKKITSVFLCFVILMSCSFGLPNYKASAVALEADVTSPGWDTTDLELIKKIDFENTNTDYLLDKDPSGNTYTQEYLHISNANGSNNKSSKVLRIKPTSELTTPIKETIALAYSYVKNNDQYLYSIPTEAGTTYRISFDIRKNTTEGYFKFYYYCGNDNYYGRKENEILNAADLDTTNTDTNNWQRMEYYITADSSTGKLAFYFNVGSAPVETLIDNITFEKVLAGVNGTTDLSYSEHQYNLLENKNLVSTGKAVTEIPVEKGVKYTFAANISGGAEDKVYLSLDGINPITKVNSAEQVYFTGSGSGRQAINFTTDTTGKIYLVTENNNGSLVLTDPYLFRTYSKAIEANLLGKAAGKATKPLRTENNSDYTKLTNSEISGGTELTVNNGDTPITENFRGVNGVYHLYNGMTDLYNRTYTEEQTEAEFDRLSDMGVKIVRSFYGSSLAYDNATKTLTYDTKDLDTFYKNCKALADRGIEVGISPNWNFDGFLNYKLSNVNNVDIFSGPGIAVKPPTGGYDPATAYTTDEFKQTMANYTEFVKQSVLNFKNEGITNIKYMFAYTECNNLFKNGTENFRNYDIIFKYYKAATIALADGLAAAGAREKGSDNYISIVGPCDTSAYDEGYINEDFVSELTRRVLEDVELKDIVDIIGSHNGYDRYYPDTEKGTFGNDYVPSFEDDTYAERAKRMLSGTKNLAAESGKEYWVDEYNVSLKLGEIDNTNEWKGTALASMITSVMNIGASNVFVWSLADQQWPNSMINNDDSFTGGLQRCGFMRSMLDSYTPYASYYAGSLLTKYIGNGKVYSVSDTSENQLYTSYIERDDGHITLLVVNYNKNGQSFNASFGKALGGKTFYKYVYNPDTVKPTEDATMIDYSAIATGVDNRLSDTLSYGDVAIYTTKCELDQVQDIAEFKGASVRYKGENDTVYKNGLRFKFNIKDALLEPGAFDGYTVVEYGFIVKRTNGNTEEFYLGDAGTLTGVAYNVDNTDETPNCDIIFKKHEDSRDFTAVLYNIGYSSGTGKINYDAYNRLYSARVYAKLRRGSDEKVIYDANEQVLTDADGNPITGVDGKHLTEKEAYNYSIFNVFDAILGIDLNSITDANKKAEAVADKKAVNDWLINPEVSKAYFHDIDIDASNPDF